jgi:hypothetical protein
MKRLNNFLFVGWLAATVSAQASSLPPDWQHEQQFNLSATGLVKISLPAETLDATRPALEDLRLYDDTGNEIPYVIERSSPSPSVVQSAKSFSSSLSADSTVITFETGLEQPMDAVTLETPEINFIKGVRLESSRDGNHWTTLAKGRPIFRQPYGAQNLKISFAPTVSKFLRLTVDDSRTPPIPFTGALIHDASGESPQVETVTAAISERDESPGQTRLALDLGAANLSLARLQIETQEPLFMRQVSVAVPQVSDGVIRESDIGQGAIYRISVEGQTPSEALYVPIERTVPSHELILLIRNGDSPPLPISSVHVERRPIYLVFLARQPGAFHLLTGNASCTAPHYDLAGLNMNLKSVAPSAVEISTLANNPTFRAPEVLPGVEIAGASLDTSAWKFRKPVKISSAGAQEIELDADVLAHANSDFADLRLMRGTNQVPYIIEHTSISRALTPTVAMTNDAGQPHLSQWMIQLPRTNLPLTRLTCQSTTSLFQRDLLLEEMLADDRGERYAHNLGTATWTQKPDDKSHEFSLALDESPQTDTLLLQTDNGDNPPIQLDQFKLFYPATRILFKAAPDETLFLYYGNPGTTAPFYDLSLVANQLLAANKNTASLGDEEPLRKSSWEETKIAGNAGVLFWGALAVVVVGLLVIISRLLPKASPPPQS